MILGFRAVLWGVAGVVFVLFRWRGSACFAFCCFLLWFLFFYVVWLHVVWGFWGGVVWCFWS